ncbi:MAG TPA: class I SAM-dependent methyltransferase, partial [Solirubrobacteraceae bacterium]
MPQTREWDGQSYDRISGPMEALGREVLQRLQLRGDETVLDAGCGSGRITQLLIERLPHGRAIAVDASQSMVDAARERLPDADVRVADLLEIELEQ